MNKKSSLFWCKNIVSWQKVIGEGTQGCAIALKKVFFVAIQFCYKKNSGYVDDSFKENALYMLKWRISWFCKNLSVSIFYYMDIGK